MECQLKEIGEHDWGVMEYFEPDGMNAKSIMREERHAECELDSAAEPRRWLKTVTKLLHPHR